MSVEDGKKINNVFVTKQKQIDSLKLTLDSTKFKHNEYMILNGRRLQSMYENYLQEHYSRKVEVDSLKTRLEANKRIYIENERTYKYAMRSSTVYSMLATFLLMVMAFAK